MYSVHVLNLGNRLLKTRLLKTQLTLELPRYPVPENVWRYLFDASRMFHCLERPLPTFVFIVIEIDKLTAQCFDGHNQ